ncbi:MAG: nitric oxide reductase activation protein NorD [Betaproteobacteria bacterium]|nr:nitric oxide reductase activation protein NorD [Betaproteobacteria bacterium]MDE2212361.1 nitric oxide reductase activation protein NorD [Betaproteobacteria bacterium]
MAVHLEDYAELLGQLPESCRQALHANWHEATRQLSGQALERYLHGAESLSRLGKGADPVLAWIEAAPAVAREVGEDALPDLMQTALGFASRTSGPVIERLLATAPVAALRLSDPELFGQYLQFLNQFIGQAPRGLRPLLDHLDVLLGQLTLGGLRRWALWGAHAHRTDFEAQAAYFSLTSKESLAVLQKERKGTLFVDVQRRIAMYLRALWGRDFFMRPTSGDFERREGYRPYIAGHLFHLPDAFDDWEGVPGTELYRAAAAHCAAHLAATTRPLRGDGLDPLQRVLVELVEDARAEALAIRRFPGLQTLWARFHRASPVNGAHAGAWFDRLARALIDPAYRDPDPWVALGRTLFAAAGQRLDTPQVSWDMGVALAHAFREKQLPFNPRTDLPSAPYRDDNRYVWAFDGSDGAPGISFVEAPRQVRRKVSLMEMVNEIDSELAGDDAQEIWVLESELFPYEDEGKSYNELEGKEPVSDPFHYAEWDYQIQLERPSWATVLERRPGLGELALIDDITARHKRLIGRMKYLLDAMQPQGVTRLRKLEEGDEVDLGAAVDALVDWRQGRHPDPRIMMRSVRKVRDIAVLVLLDLSESTNEQVAGQEHTVLDLTREAAVLLADAIHKVGDPFAIHGFCSDGRHDVRYWRFKDFADPYGPLAKARLAGMRGQLSTRMGAALRHAAAALRAQPAARKLLLVLTDGEPADVDVRDPQYLRYDARKAVEEAGRHGIATYCMTLDPRADQYVSRIFGARRYQVLDQVERLPEKLPMLYAGLTR